MEDPLNFSDMIVNGLMVRYDFSHISFIFICLTQVLTLILSMSLVSFQKKKKVLSLVQSKIYIELARESFTR
jgi:hypothetical protein